MKLVGVAAVAFLASYCESPTIALAATALRPTSVGRRTASAMASASP